MHRPFHLTLLAIAVLAAASAPSVAQERRVPADQQEVRLSYSPVVKRAAPAVVNVYVRRRVKTMVSPFFDDPWFRQFFGSRGGFGVPRERVQNSLGSGVIVAPDGVVVTNNHVIKGRGEAEIKVALADRREFNAEVILVDQQTDLAVLRLQANGEVFPYLEFADSDALEVGDLVLAIGNPFGVGQTVTSGIVSALARTRVGVSDYQFFIQTDAAINPGNSGGALVDMNGRLTGINTAIYSRTGGSHGIGFATPSNMVRPIVLSALQGKHVQRPWLGARLQGVSSDIAESLGIDRPAGALVQEVYDRSPAARAGLRSGDVIVSVDGKPTADPRALRYRFSTKGLDGVATLGVIRSGKIVDVSVPLESAPEDPPRSETILQGNNPLAGAKVANLSPALAEELSMDDDSYGVVVMSIKDGTPADNVGLRRGDIVVRVNRARIQSAGQLAELVSRPARAWELTVKRGDRLLNVVVGG